MKPIRPLFRYNPGFGVPQLHGEFKDWVGDPFRGTLESNQNARKETLRYAVVRDSRCREKRYIALTDLRFACIPGIVEWARKRGSLFLWEVDYLRRFLTKTLSKHSHQDWLRTQTFDFCTEGDWSEEDNHEKFELYVMACFVDFFRPGEIDWVTPNMNDLKTVLKLLDAFTAEAKQPGDQRKLLLKLFDHKIRLSRIAVEAKVGLSREDQELLLECLRLRLRGEVRARWLAKNKFRGFGKSPLTKFKENPDSMRAQLSHWTQMVLED